MAIKIAITNEKGGCGKTTTAVNLSSILAECGYKVLLIDGDYQSYSTSYLMLYNEEQHTIYEVMKGCDGQAAVLDTSFGFWLLPSAMKFRSMEEELTLAKLRGEQYEYILKDSLSTCEDAFDFIICDCPPNGDKVQQNIEAYVDYLILPTIPDDNAIHTLLVKSSALVNTKRLINPRLSVLGVLIVSEHMRHVNDRLYSSQIKEQTIFHCFETSIRHSTDFKRALNLHEPINIYDKKCGGNRDYQAFTDEVLNCLMEGC